MSRTLCFALLMALLLSSCASLPRKEGGALEALKEAEKAPSHTAVEQRPTSLPSTASAPAALLSPMPQDGVTLSREDWLIIRQAQERRRTQIKTLQVNLDHCKREKKIAAKRERDKVAAVQKSYEIAMREAHHRRVVLYVTIGAGATLIVVAFIGGMVTGLNIK